MARTSRGTWRGRLALAVSATTLLAIAAAYWLTVEPAPAVTVQWREDIDARRQAETEAQFLLRDPRPGRPNNVTYDLLDTSRNNIAALLAHPAVERVEGIDPQSGEVRFDAPYGTHWTWAARRVPVLRERGVIEGVLLAATLSVALGVFRGLRRRR